MDLKSFRAEDYPRCGRLEIVEEQLGMPQHGRRLKPLGLKKVLQQTAGVPWSAAPGRSDPARRAPPPLRSCRAMCGWASWRCSCHKDRARARMNASGCDSPSVATLSFGENLFRLFQVSRRADLREPGLDFDQPGHNRMHITGHTQRPAVGKNFRVELIAPRRLLVAGGRARVAGHRLEQPIGDVEFALLPLPQVIMRQFMAEDGFDFLRVQQAQTPARRTRRGPRRE